MIGKSCCHSGLIFSKTEPWESFEFNIGHPTDWCSSQPFTFTTNLSNFSPLAAGCLHSAWDFFPSCFLYWAATPNDLIDWNIYNLNKFTVRAKNMDFFFAENTVRRHPPHPCYGASFFLQLNPTHWKIMVHTSTSGVHVGSDFARRCQV